MINEIFVSHWAPVVPIPCMTQAQLDNELERIFENMTSRVMGNYNEPGGSGSTIGSVAGTRESAEASLILSGGKGVVAERRGLVDKWTADNPEVIRAVLDKLGRIATKGKSDRDAIAASKVLLDHAVGRPPEAIEQKPNQSLTINRYGVDPNAEEPYANEG